MVTEPQIIDALKHLTNAIQTGKKDVQDKVTKPQTDTLMEDVPSFPMNPDHQGYNVKSSQNMVTEPQIIDALKHLTDAMQEDMENEPVFLAGVVNLGCSVRSNPDKVSEPRKSGSLQRKTEVQKLTEEQISLLKTLFKTNIAKRGELQKDDCEKVSSKFTVLQNLTWKKIKNTVHNWIMAEKKKTKMHF